MKIIILDFIKSSFLFFKEFIGFLISPNPNIEKTAWDYKTILKIAFVGLFVYVIGFLIQVTLCTINIDKALAPPDSELVKYVDSCPNWLFLLSACLIAPIAEELFLRLPLISTPKNILISIIVGVCTFLFFTRTAIADIYFKHTVHFELHKLIPAFIIFGVSITYYFLNKRYPNRKAIFGIYFFLMAFLFGVLHRFNFIQEPIDVFLAFKETFIQSFSGLYYGFVRMKFGTKISIMAHSIWNSIPTMLRIFF